MNRKLTIILGFILTGHLICFSQPSPGDVFKEYTWCMPSIEGNEQFLRVGGKIDYRMNIPKFPEGHFKDGNILIDHDVSLKKACKAEIVIEKMLCHDYTRGLAIQINKNTPLIIPESKNIPGPQYSYMHHFYPVAGIPLDYLKEGKNNFFSLDVDTVQPWNWPQNLIYGLTLRVYYDIPPEEIPEIVLEGNGKGITDLQEIQLDVSNPEKIEKVEYIGLYEGINWEGDGFYRQWHYTYFKGKLTNHIGTATSPPFAIEWNTRWIPDQDDPILLAARVHYKNTLICFTPALENLSLNREHSVELCKPYDQPKQWLTRNDEHSCHFDIEGDLSKATEARLLWKSWSPGYMNGLYVNDILVFIREGGRYAYHGHNIPLEDLTILEQGKNTIKTGKTPLYHGHMVHGTEMQWPGVMVLIKYE